MVKEENLHLHQVTSSNILCAPGKKSPCSFFGLFPVLVIYCLAEQGLCCGSNAGLYHTFVLLLHRYLHVFLCLILLVWDKRLENSFQPLTFKSLLKMHSTPHVCGALLTVAGQNGS